LQRPEDAGRFKDILQLLFAHELSENRARAFSVCARFLLIKIVAVLLGCHDFAARLTFHLLSQTVR
jgi:hypothetical protein